MSGEKLEDEKKVPEGTLERLNEWRGTASSFLAPYWDSAGDWAGRKIEGLYEGGNSLSFRAKVLAKVVFYELVFVSLLWLTGLLNAILEYSNFYKLQYVVAILIAAPPAYLVWLWRDQNHKADQEIKRYDASLKDFHRVEEWATTLPKDRDESILQIAAIYQLVPYLLGENGKSFQRPTYEIVKTFCFQGMFTIEPIRSLLT